MFGLLTAWALVRYEFPGKALINALVDLPFALPTAVAGIALATLYAPNGWIGQFLTPLGIKVAYTPLGVVIALTFIGLPFVVRTLEPVMRDLSADVEEAAASLGAGRLAIHRRASSCRPWRPAWLTGFTLAFARGIGEYGSVIFIAGNMPYKSEIAPLLIVIQLEQYDYAARRGHRAGAAGRSRSPCCSSSTASRPGRGGSQLSRRVPPMPTEDPLWIKAIVLTLVVGFLALVLMLPLAAVFVEALRKGVGAGAGGRSTTPTPWPPSS